MPCVCYCLLSQGLYSARGAIEAQVVVYSVVIFGCHMLTVSSTLVKVHMRRRHGAPPAVPKNGMSVGNDDDE